MSKKSRQEGDLVLQEGQVRGRVENNPICRAGVWIFSGMTQLIFYIIIRLAPRAGKMNQIVHCDRLPERARWSHLARSGLPAVSRKQNFTKSHIINPLLTKFVRLRWLDIGLVFFLRIKHAKKELGQYPAILTSHLVNNPYVNAM